MAVKLRLRRMGKKKQPIYKVVAADVRSPRDGKFIEAIGLYNPLTNPAQINIFEDRAMYWLSVGAQPTKTVKNLLSKSGILLKRELVKEGLDEAKINLRMEEFYNLHEAKAESKVKVADKKAPVEEVKTELEEPKVDAIEEKAEVEKPKVETVEEVKTEAAQPEVETVEEKSEAVVEEVKKKEVSEKLDSAAEAKGTVSEDSDDK